MTEKLTAEEKLKLLCGKDNWRTDGLNGKLPEIWMSDGPVGLRKVYYTEDGTEKSQPSIAYPAIQALANTFSKECARLMGECLADDAIECYVDILLAPGVNIKRNPLNGRNFEYFSEDPFLAGTLAYEYIDGLQTGGVGACLKHFAVNNLEYQRSHQTSDVDERTLRELYYKPFEIACKAKPVSVMCSYNRVNGVYASENKKGYDVLRNEFGFDGVIISDWGAVHDRTAAAKAGLDLEMPFDKNNYENFVADHKNGKITEKELDVCAARMVKLVERAAADRKKRKIKRTTEERINIAADIYAESVVLLKNDGVLPLSGKESVSISGKVAKSENYAQISGGGSSFVTRKNHKFDLPSCLAERIKGKVVYDEAFDWINVNWENSRAAILSAAESDVAIVCVWLGGHENEGADRQVLTLPEVQVKQIRETARQNSQTVVIVFAGSAVDMSDWMDEVSAIVFAGYPGEKGDEVLADILTGVKNPCGKLSETFALSLDDVPAVRSYMGIGVTRYQEGLDVGYRYFDKYEVPVAFPFGHGLSYSRFKYGNLKLTVKNGLNVAVEYEIENISSRSGKEISQVYVRECVPLVYRPFKELKAFSKNEISAGGKIAVKLELDRSSFAYWSVAKDEWTADDGIYEIIVGASCEDERLAAKIKICGGKAEVIG